ncbi:RES family NAD+ phosphorylase [Brumimicrobium oceani]|uniref:RES domain-containing protein n=1 Tax=Brumimicrobium oceani TaxID=2100725 RepID=A0A2U2XBM3_9FLAO|nr:RES family NAD+ phosphorylase [Brumimicrobium oceani]PWH85150.1 hypothetical protein DIT68_10970 [Brumimicrobium oceani]
MKVYRISKTEYAKDLGGTGAKLYGGRWNHIDTPCIYTSESRALAVLEYSVNINIEYIPKDLSLCVFEIDDKYLHEITPNEIPTNWNATPSPYSTKTMGTELFKNNIGIIKAPSIVIPEEYNFILNPSLIEKAFQLIEIKNFNYDLRIKNF